MGREKDEYVTEHYEQTADFSKCRYCEIKLKGKPSVTRLKHHLLGEKNKGVRICEQVPEEVKVAVQAGHSNKRRRMESNSVNSEMPNPASTSLPPENNHLVQEQAGMQNEVHGTEQDRSWEGILEFSNPEPMPEQLRTRKDRAIPLLTSELVGETYKKKLEEICSSLMEENVCKVGIYGMGGAGKTELARHIYNSLLEHPNYDFVCWITVSPDFSIRKLQSIIANAINFDLPNEDVEIMRAELSRRLSKKKFVIILDDLWSYISFHDVGMTDESFHGCKLILTTRSLNVCRTMNCQKNVEVDGYGIFDDGKWDMFIKELGKEGSLSGEIETVAKDIVGACGGLPLMIKSMARSMRGVEDIHEWRNALEEMKSSKMNEPYVEVFHKLKRSYDHLEVQSMQQCLLYCALFDGNIGREDLIEHLIVEGIIEETGNRRAKFDKGHTLLNKLHNACLLRGGSDCTYMHGLIRKMAFQIMKENLPSKVEFSEEIIYLFMKDVMRISLKVPNEAFNPSDYVATCPNVSTLLLPYHRRLRSIEDSFCDQLQNLKVLNLSCSSIVELPKSVGGLKNLKALFLRGCHKLKHIPSLRKLESLEVLDLRICAVKKLPKGVKWLSNLRVLNLLGSDIIEIGAGILKRLLNLEFLAFNKPSKLAEEIAGLPKLESLIWWFSDIDEFNSFSSKARSPSLIAYSLYVGQCDRDWDYDRTEPSGRKVSFAGGNLDRTASEWAFERFLHEASQVVNDADKNGVVQTNENSEKMTTTSLNDIPVDSEYQAFLRRRLDMACAAAALSGVI